MSRARTASVLGLLCTTHKLAPRGRAMLRRPTTVPLPLALGVRLSLRCVSAARTAPVNRLPAASGGAGRGPGARASPSEFVREALPAELLLASCRGGRPASPPCQKRRHGPGFLAQTEAFPGSAHGTNRPAEAMEQFTGRSKDKSSPGLATASRREGGQGLAPFPAAEGKGLSCCRDQARLKLSGVGTAGLGGPGTLPCRGDSPARPRARRGRTDGRTDLSTCGLQGGACEASRLDASGLPSRCIAREIATDALPGQMCTHGSPRHCRARPQSSSQRRLFLFDQGQMGNQSWLPWHCP